MEFVIPFEPLAEKHPQPVFAFRPIHRALFIYSRYEVFARADLHFFQKREFPSGQTQSRIGNGDIQNESHRLVFREDLDFGRMIKFTVLFQEHGYGFDVFGRYSPAGLPCRRNNPFHVFFR